MGGLVEALINRKPAVLLLAIDLPGLGGPSGIRKVKRISPATKIIVLSRNTNESEEREVLRTGAHGYWGPVQTETLLKMIDKVRQGEIWAGRRSIGALLEECAGGSALRQMNNGFEEKLRQLTSREREILQLVSDGASNKEIALALNVSVSTVKAHLTRIFRKLGQPDRVHLALAAAVPRADQ